MSEHVDRSKNIRTPTEYVYKCYFLRYQGYTLEPKSGTLTLIETSDDFEFSDTRKDVAGREVASVTRDVLRVTPILVTVRRLKSRKETLLWVNWDKTFQSHSVSKYVSLRQAGKLSKRGTF